MTVEAGAPQPGQVDEVDSGSWFMGRMKDEILEEDLTGFRGHLIVGILPFRKQL
jgi:hypothetical protein